MPSAHPLLLKAADIARMPGEVKTHFLNPNAVRNNKSLGDAVGLQHLGVHLIEVAPGRDSTEYHTHWHEEECVYVLSGNASLTIDGEVLEFAAGDFVGFPAQRAAHAIHNSGSEPLLCLVMGQRLAQDVCDYPHQRQRLYRNSGRWDVAHWDAITEMKRKP